MNAEQIADKAKLCVSIALFVKNTEYYILHNYTSMHDCLDVINDAYEISVKEEEVDISTEIFKNAVVSLRNEFIDIHNKIAEEIGCNKIKTKSHKKVAKTRKKVAKKRR